MLGVGRREAEHSRDSSTAEELDLGSRRHDQIDTTPGTLKVTISRPLCSKAAPLQHWVHGGS